MKKQINKAIILLAAIIPVLFQQCTNPAGKTGREAFPYPTATRYATILHGPHAIEKTGNIKVWVGHCQFKGSGELTWQTSIEEEGAYDLVLNYAMDKEGASVTISSGKKVFTQELPRTKGVFDHFTIWLQFNCERILLSEKLKLNKGDNTIRLKIDAPDQEFETNIYTLELVPVSKKAEIMQELEKVEKSRPDMDWFASMKYGAMFHWTSMTMPREGEKKTYKDAVRDFDVDAFAAMLERMGVDYIIFTGNHAEPHFPGPLKKWEEVFPGMTTERDLISEISDALRKKDIRFILYLATHVYAKYDKADFNEFERLNFELIAEIGEYYKDKIDGLWLDGWYQCNEKFPAFDYEQFYQISKTGNPNRLLALNTWLYTITTPWQDYWAGEVYFEGVPSVNRICQSGPANGLQFHHLVVMEEEGWVHMKTGKIGPPLYEPDRLFNYVSSCAGKGPVTINVLIYQDGTVSEESLAVLEKVNQYFKKGPEDK